MSKTQNPSKKNVGSGKAIGEGGGGFIDLNSR